MGGFTKGPWVVLKSTPEEGSELFYIKAQYHSASRCFSKVICEVHGPQDDIVQMANVNIIKAAPDMLEALEELVEQLEGEYFNFRNARKAIAKAKGE